jgi:hypothetical protein
MLHYTGIARLVKVVFGTLEEKNIATIKVKVKYTTEEARKAYGVAEVPKSSILYYLRH